MAPWFIGSYSGSCKVFQVCSTTDINLFIIQSDNKSFHNPKPNVQRFLTKFFRGVFGRSTSSTVLCISVFCHVVFFQLSVLRCVVLRFAVCCVLVFSLLCCVVLCCDLLCVLFLSSPCCVALCCVAICYCIRLTFFYYHLPSFQHRTEELDRQTRTASPARRARPTPRNAGRSTSSTVLCISVLSFVMLCSSSCVEWRCVAICCVLCSCLFPVVLRCDLLCVLFLSSPCCVALCCVAICYCIRLTFFYYHLPSFQHRTEQLDRQTTASPARRARPTPQL